MCSGKGPAGGAAAGETSIRKETAVTLKEKRQESREINHKQMQIKIMKKSFLNRILQNTARPEGFWGRMILRGMNRFHAPLARWATGFVEWQPEWTTLDIGCGGGANVALMLDLCPGGKAYGLDLSEESVAFARRRNRRWLGGRCFIRQGDARHLPYGDGMFDAVTAFETVYFWQDLGTAFGEVSRVLRQGGTFLICCEASDPSNDVWTSRIDNMTVYSQQELEARLAAAGFSEIKVFRRPKEDLCVIARKA